MAEGQSLKLALLLLCSLLIIHYSTFCVHALNVGVQFTDSTVSVKKQCSKKCESEFCSVPPFLRYGKYCGLLYSGCPGEKPCDGLDGCCMKHDACIQAKNNDYLSQECTQELINCMAYYKNSTARTFKGSKCQVKGVVHVITVVMEAALLVGRALHKP